MHILYLHQYFVTTDQVGGTRSYEFARRFVKSGNKVTLLTARNRSIPWDEKSFIKKRIVDGIDVLEINAGYSDARYGTSVTYYRRMVSFIQFMLLSCLVVLRLPKHDVVFATSTPLTIGIPGILASKKWNVPLIFEVRDLWPEAPIQVGALKNSFLIYFSKRLELTIYRNSKHIIALSPGMADGVKDVGIPDKKITVITNASDQELFRPYIYTSSIKRNLNLNGKFVCSYFGAMGEANDLTHVVKAANILKKMGNNDVLFILHGHGKRRSQLEAMCEEYDLNNVVFSDSVNDKQYVAQLAAASDLCMTIYKNLNVFYTCSPNKLFDSLAAGRPVLVNTPGWLKNLVEDNKVGVYVEPESPESIVEKIIFLQKNPNLLKEFGRNARELAENKFSRDILFQKIHTVFLNA